MANSKQAEKRARQSADRRAANMSQRSTLRTAIKKARAAIGTGVAADAAKEMQAATSIIDKIAGKGIIHRNKAARTKSRLAAKVKALAAA
jgi:small subunit ribosomal protein S20